MENWIKVFEAGSPVRAEIVKGVLEQFEINAVVLNKKDSIYQIHGQYEVMVPKEEVPKALNIIENEIAF
jgi:hypothetical protein